MAAGQTGQIGAPVPNLVVVECRNKFVHAQILHPVVPEHPAMAWTNKHRHAILASAKVNSIYLHPSHNTNLLGYVWGKILF